MKVYLVMMYNYPCTIWSNNSMAINETLRLCKEEDVPLDDVEEVCEIVEVDVDSIKDMFT